ncbi:MAG: hypothetical protein IKO72_11105 [Kiritimatiellae bacterium]|nr:hypothetical protein [Kiritimatiellia bacterium]
MKKLATCILALITAFAIADGADDAVVTFSTRGPDRYADGTTVMDGECYALVWSKDGVFEGLSANGEPIDSADQLVLVAPLAKDGHCPEIIFQLPASVATSLAKGVYEVLLLDTRVTNASGATAPYGMVGGKLKVVNSYGEVAAGLSIAKSSGNGGLNADSNSEVTGTSVAASNAKPPAGVAQPRIKQIRVIGDNVFLTVENLRGFMRVQGGGTPGSVTTMSAAKQTDGDSMDVTLVAPKLGSSGFYKVMRN